MQFLKTDLRLRGVIDLMRHYKFLHYRQGIDGLQYAAGGNTCMAWLN